MAKSNHQQLSLDKGLIAAAAASSMLKVRAALDLGANVNYQDAEQSGWTALHFCCYFSATEKSAERICKTLLTRGAKPDMLSQDGTSALLAASAVGSLEAVGMLLERHANVNLADKGGKTPLMGAADRGDIDVINALLIAGADPSLADAQGCMAIDVASAKGHQQVVAAIESYLIRQEIRSPSIPKPRI